MRSFFSTIESERAGSLQFIHLKNSKPQELAKHFLRLQKFFFKKLLPQC